jgi:hypothetical protein
MSCSKFRGMSNRKWILIVLPLLISGCSKRNTEPVTQAEVNQAPPVAASAPAPAQTPAGQAAPPQATQPAAAIYDDPGRNSAFESARQARFEGAIPRGAALRVRLDESLSTRRNRAGHAFYATLEAPVVVDGRTALPSGTRFTGRVTEADASGRLKGRAVLGITLESFRFEGQEQRCRTSSVVRASAPHRNRNIGFIAGGSGLGAAIGAIAGGGKGAAIGAVAGGAAGTAGAAATGKLEIGIPAETMLRFMLQAPVRL